MLTNLTALIQAHTCEHFDYNFAVDWAISLIQEGKETPNIVMLASFGAPIDSLEIRPYVSAVLKDFGLEELEGDEAVLSVIHYYTFEIWQGRFTRKNLRQLHELYLQYNRNFDLVPFYLLYYSWNALEAREENYYYDGATLDNIEALLKTVAQKWLESH